MSDVEVTTIEDILDLVLDGAKAIPLSRGLFTVVDAEDYDFLMQWKWYAQSNRRGGYYAVRNSLSDSNGNRRQIRMHMELVGTPTGMATDHINGNPLDNRRSNLRICTRAENNRNRGSVPNTTSRFKGVSWDKKSQKFRSQIRMDEKVVCLGWFVNEEDAAKAYNEAAIRSHGEFARLNQIDTV